MTSNAKISAFTIHEMIVVLLLSSIIVGMAFMSLRLIQKHVLAIQENYNQNMELTKLENALWIDIHKYSKLEFSVQTKLLKLTTPIDTIFYKFEKEYITNPKDTFNIANTKAVFYFDGTITNKLNKIDAIEILTDKELGNKTIFVYKQNAASDFLN